MENTTRTKLMEIATQLFATKGFAAVSVRELTAATHINVSAISYHFNSKEGLYQAVLEEQFLPILDALNLVKSQEFLLPIERLTLYSKQIARIHAQRPFLARFMSNELTNPTDYGGPIIENHISQIYQFIDAALQEGIARGDFRADLNITYTAISLAGILNFYFIGKPLFQKITPLTEQDNTEYIANAFQVYLHGIITAPAKG